MLIYHGSTMKIDSPLTTVCRDNLDSGKGFYTTSLKEQAIRWASRVAGTKDCREAWLNIYELDAENVYPAYRVLRFEMYDERWLDFVVGNRRGEKLWKEYDMIEGGIANDRIFNTIELYFSGLIQKGEALKRLSFEQSNNQICILNQEIIDLHLSFIEALPVELKI